MHKSEEGKSALAGATGLSLDCMIDALTRMTVRQTVLTACDGAAENRTHVFISITLRKIKEFFCFHVQVVSVLTVSD